MADVNLISAAVGGVVTVVAAIVVARAAKNSDARVVAEAALWNNQPKIITEQNHRIERLQTEIDRLWAQVQETYARERKCREDLSECQHKIAVLEARLGGDE